MDVCFQHSHLVHGKFCTNKVAVCLLFLSTHSLLLRSPFPQLNSSSPTKIWINNSGFFFKKLNVYSTTCGKESENCGVFVCASSAAAFPQTCLHIRCTAAASNTVAQRRSIRPARAFWFWLLSVGSRGGQKLFEPRIPQELPVLVCALVCLVAEMWWAWMGGNNTARRNQETLTHCQVRCVHRSDGDAKRLGLPCLNFALVGIGISLGGARPGLRHSAWLRLCARRRRRKHKVDRRRLKVWPVGVSGPSELLVLSWQGDITGLGLGKTNAFNELYLIVVFGGTFSNVQNYALPERCFLMTTWREVIILKVCLCSFGNKKKKLLIGAAVAQLVEQTVNWW